MEDLVHGELLRCPPLWGKITVEVEWMLNERDWASGAVARVKVWGTHTTFPGAWV